MPVSDSLTVLFFWSVSRCGRSSARHFIRGEKFDPAQHAERDAKKKKKKGGADDDESYNEHKGAHTEWIKERSAQTGDQRVADCSLGVPRCLFAQHGVSLRPVCLA